MDPQKKKIVMVSVIVLALGVAAFNLFFGGEKKQKFAGGGGNVNLASDQAIVDTTSGGQNTYQNTSGPVDSNVVDTANTAKKEKQEAVNIRTKRRKRREKKLVPFSFNIQKDAVVKTTFV